MDKDLQNTYDVIYDNLPLILSRYGSIFDPEHNKTTRDYLMEHNDINIAYPISFMTTILLYENFHKSI